MLTARRVGTLAHMEPAAATLQRPARMEAGGRVPAITKACRERGERSQPFPAKGAPAKGRHFVAGKKEKSNRTHIRARCILEQCIMSVVLAVACTRVRLTFVHLTVWYCHHYVILQSINVEEVVVGAHIFVARGFSRPSVCAQSCRAIIVCLIA